jgi:hypothetical protein
MNVTNATNLTDSAPCRASVSNATRCHGEGGGDEKHDGRMRGAGGLAHLMSSVFQTLSQTVAAQTNAPAVNTATPAAPAAPAAPTTGETPASAAADPAPGTAQNQDTMQKVLSFMQTLFSAMAQMGGHGHGHHGHGRGHGKGHDCGDKSPVSAMPGASTASAAPVLAAPATPEVTATGVTPPVEAMQATNTAASPLRHYEDHGRGGGLVGTLQSLLQQIGVSGSGETSGPLAELNTAFQNLFGPTQPAGDATTARPTLQDFLQKLVHNITGGGADTGAASGSLINITA